MINSPSAALATHLEYDNKELAEYKYQPGRFTRTVYALNDAYYCATADKKKLPKNTRGDANFKWVEVPDRFVNDFGYFIFKATETED